MKTFRAYLLLITLLLFLGYFGVYGFYTTVVESIGSGWALAGAGVIALGSLIVAAVGVTMIRTRPPDLDKAVDD